MREEQAAKHTPGPWSAISAADGKGDFGILADGHGVLPRVVIAEVYASIDFDGQRAEAVIANARLIAAAPEYFDAVHWIEQAVRTNAAPVNVFAALEELAVDGKHVTLDAGLVLDLLKAHARATGRSE